MRCVAILGLLAAAVAATTERIAVEFSNGAVSSVAFATAGRPAAVTVERSMREGWDTLTFRPNTAVLGTTDKAKVYAAVGAAEGFLTKQTIFFAYNNTFGSFLKMLPPPVTAGVDAFMKKQVAWMRAEAAKPTPSLFTAQLALFLAQLDGLVAGTAFSSDRSTSALTFRDVYLASYQEEVYDVLATLPQMQQHFQQNTAVAALVRRQRAMAKQHCSALIKLTEDDLFLAHDTWSSYNTMLRQYKTYADLPAADGRPTTISMSSYPGSLSSVDDWYMTSRKLAVTETTNGAPDAMLATIQTSTVTEFMRAMIANALADDGKTWVDLFMTLNSGTYNNQYMVVDMKVARSYFAAKRSGNRTSAITGLLNVVEQMPDPYSRRGDLSAHLIRESYWASYNIPYFPEVFEAAGFGMQEKLYGSFFSYTNYSRAKIFRKLQAGVRTMGDMKRVMRYNEFATDPDSLIPNCTGAPEGKCTPPFSPMLSIASRGDLALRNGENGTNYGTALPGSVGQNTFGATDSKITSYRGMMRDFGTNTGVVINGPTSDNADTPVFDFGRFLKDNAPHYDDTVRDGVPDVFDFSFVSITV